MNRYLTINGEALPIAFNNKAIATWCHAMKIPLKAFGQIDDEIDLYQAVHLLYYTLQEGHARAGLKFKITVDDCFGYTDADSSLITRLFALMTEARSVNVSDQPEGGEEKKIP